MTRFRNIGEDDHLRGWYGRIALLLKGVPYAEYAEFRSLKIGPTSSSGLHMPVITA